MCGYYFVQYGFDKFAFSANTFGKLAFRLSPDSVISKQISRYENFILAL